MKNIIKRHEATNHLIFVGFKVSYPNVVETATNTANPDEPFEEYSADILIPKDTDMSEFEAVIEDVKQDRWDGDTPTFRYEFLKDGDQKFNKKTGEVYDGYGGHWYVTVKAKANDKPTVIDLAKNILERPDAIRGGDIVTTFAAVYAYGRAGNNGIGFGLNTMRLDEKSDNPFGGGISSQQASMALDQYTDDDLGI